MCTGHAMQTPKKVGVTRSKRLQTVRVVTGRVQRLLETRVLHVARLALAGGLCACGPIASFRPASGLMPDRHLEVGAGAARVTARPYVDEDPASAGQVWVSGDVGERLSLTAISAFDSDALGLGGAARVNMIRFDRFAAGSEVELGYAWAAVSLPLALRVVEQTWIYSGPRLGTWGLDRCFFIPLGVSVHVYEGFILRAEWQRSWQDFKYYNRRDHYGLAAAYQF
jgi:hypothetical protein